MIVVTAGTAEYRPMIEKQAERCAEFGYAHRIYDLGGLGFGKPCIVYKTDLAPTYKASLPPCTFKAQLLLANMDSGELVCWLDGDCIPLHPFKPEGEWDAAVTLRPEHEIGRSGVRATAYLNTGVLWATNTKLVSEWRSASYRANTDQGAMNEIVGQEFSKQQWKQSRGKIVTTPQGYRIKILDAAEWNCWQIPPPAGARILHFKRDRRHLAAEYCACA